MKEVLDIVVDWLPLIVGVAALVVAYVAWGRRRLAVWVSHARLISQPHDGLDLVVTHDGAVIDRPFYLVYMQLKCTGNRDIAMEPDGEFIDIATPPGTEFVTVRYGAPGTTAVKLIDRSPSRTRFKFDLLKVRETVHLNLFVKTKQELENTPLDGLFPVTAHVKDVRVIRHAQYRYEFYSGVVAGFIFAGVALASYFWTSFSPTAVEKLLTDGSGTRVTLGEVSGTSIKVCEATKSTWDTAQCRDRPMSEVATFKPAHEDGQAYYTNSSEPWARFGGALVIGSLIIFIAFVDRLPNLIRRMIKRYLPKAKS